MQLHSRESLHVSTHRDYKMLMLAQLEHDLAWVRSLYAQLDLVKKGSRNLDMKPMDTKGVEVKAEVLASPIVSVIRLGTMMKASRESAWSLAHRCRTKVTRTSVQKPFS